MTRTHRIVIVALLAAAGLPGCKGNEGGDTKETLDKLASAQKLLAERDKELKELREEVASLEAASANSAGGTWTFDIQGDVLTLASKPQSGKSPAVIDDATATKLSEQFVGLVQGSRAALQRCYEQALKKTSALANKTTNLKITASFAASGGLTNVSFSPELPESFATCLRGVAGKWKLPEGKAPMTFQAPVKLTPT